MGRVDGKVVIITGGAGGQGSAHARLLVEEGARVVVADIAEERGRTVADAIGKDAVFVRLDVGDEQQWHETLGATLAAFGRLDLLVNNAGVIRRLGLADSSLEDFDLHYRAHELGPFLGIKTCVHALTESGRGSVINVSSSTALTGMAAASGVLFGPLGGVTQNIGLDFTLRAFIVVVVGGMGNLGGSILASIFISLLEAYAALIVSPAQAVIVSFVALILTLLFRPTGLFVPTPK
jgi:3alpha(or 20beta)-hydroxysteroid dehydrogenase